MSSNQLARTLGLTVKTAWFLSHRIREAIREGDLAPFGPGGGAVEVDETYIGRKKGMPIRGAYHHKMAVLGLVDRESGRARLFHVDQASGRNIQPIVLDNLSREARVMTRPRPGARSRNGRSGRAGNDNTPLDASPGERPHFEGVSK
jgi:hypothetical protein